MGWLTALGHTRNYLHAQVIWIHCMTLHCSAIITSIVAVCLKALKVYRNMHKFLILIFWCLRITLKCFVFCSSSIILLRAQHNFTTIEYTYLYIYRSKKRTTSRYGYRQIERIGQIDEYLFEFPNNICWSDQMVKICHITRASI